MNTLNFISRSVSDFPFFILLNEILFLKNYLMGPRFPYQKSSQKTTTQFDTDALGSFSPVFLTVSDKPSAKHRQKQISHDVVA